MRLEIVQIADRGVANKERLHLRVLADANLNTYVVCTSKYLTPSSISNTVGPTYWFNTKLVRPGDNVILYTGSGTDTSSPTADGHTNYFFYWRQPKTIWHESASCAVLFEVNTWQTSKN